MSEREKTAIRKIAVLLYQEGAITFEEQMKVLELLCEEKNCASHLTVSV